VLVEVVEDVVAVVLLEDVVEVVVVVLIEDVVEVVAVVLVVVVVAVVVVVVVVEVVVPLQKLCTKRHWTILTRCTWLTDCPVHILGNRASHQACPQAAPRWRPQVGSGTLVVSIGDRKEKYSCFISEWEDARPCLLAVFIGGYGGRSRSGACCCCCCCCCCCRSC